MPTPPGSLREHFALPPGRIYLNGNSLGAMPLKAREALLQGLDAHWAKEAVGAWNSADWVHLPQRLGAAIAPLLGAAPGQTIVADSTSVNLFKLLDAALARHPGRKLLLLEEGAFPTDNYMAQGYARLRPGLELIYKPAADIASALQEDVAAVLLSHVQYRSGSRVDLPSLQAQAKALDIPVVWDLAHSAGALPLELDAWGVEYAVGCGYKFLNGGPGAPSFAYVAQHRQAELQPVLSGWFGHKQPFAFGPDFDPAPGIDRLKVGTPPILSMLALEAAVQVLQKADIHSLWAQSQALFDALYQALSQAPECADCQILTPTEPEQRGSQLSLRHPQAAALCRALAEVGVVADYREPGLLRFGLAPAYNSLEEVREAAARLIQILRTGLWREARFAHGPKVT